MLDEKTIRSNITEYNDRLEDVSLAYEELRLFLGEKELIVSEVRDKAERYLIRYIKGLRIDPHGISLPNVRAPLNKESYDGDLVTSIYKAMIYSSFYKEASSLYEHTSSSKRVINKAKTVLKNNLVWTFMSKDKKDESVRAMNEINRLYELNYMDRVADIVDRFDNFKLDGAKKEFFDHAEQFVTFANQFAQTRFYSEQDPAKPDFGVLRSSKNRYGLLLRSINGYKDLLSGQSEKVKAGAVQMANREALTILKDVSIDEVNKQKKGLRTSALKGAGIETIADALIKSEYAIASIYGISELNAHVIKRFAEEKFINTRNSVKLKLNADKKSEESTKLLNELYKYIGLKEQLKEVEVIINEYGRAVNAAVSALSGKDGDARWLYSDPNMKTYYDNVRQLFEALDKQQIIEKFDQTQEKVGTISSNDLNDDELWKYYEDNSAKCISYLEELMPEYFGNADTFYGLPEELAEEIQEECIFPDGLLVTLRRYQEWGVKYILHQKKVLLGDEMGLGKTVQAIASMVSLRNLGEKHFMVVCPASVLINWCREIEQHSKLKPIKMHGAGRKYAFDKWMKEGDVGVTTYETVGSFEMADDFKYSMLVVDEAHYVKNSKALRTRNIINIGNHTGRILYMTGTALENKVDEMIELISQLQPSVAKEASSYAYISSSEIFRQRVAPVYYRRKREDVLTELPELIESKEWCSLEGEEKEIYERAILGRHRDEARRVSWNVDDLSNSSKARRLKEIVEQVKDDGRKLIVFSFYLDTIRKLYEYFHGIALFPITGSVNVNKRQEIIDEFEKAPAGSMLITQITAGGTGLNIQAASVVVIAEPQIKPSIENQAISRAYRMGQTRNVLVYRLLCENTIDEKMIQMLEKKQSEFDAFADKSVAAQESLELDNKTMGNIIEEEIERIQKERSENGGIDISPEEKPINPNRRNMEPVSVTERIKVVSQPYGGYLRPKDMKSIQFNDGRVLEIDENRSPQTVGVVVDYLTRFMIFHNAYEAFKISATGAVIKDKVTKGGGKELVRFEELVREVTGLDDRSIINACLLSEYDVWKRNLLAAMSITDHQPVTPDQKTIGNIRTMVERSIDFFNKYSPVIKDGFTFEPDGYSEVVTSGDGDFLSKNTLWDFKVSKYEPTKDNTLQLLMYYIMGKHSGNSDYDGIDKIGIFNPRLNKAYIYEMKDYPEDQL